MIPRVYQEELSDLGATILRENMIVYLAWEERTGKSLTSILIAEKVNAQRVLIVTKKKPKPDWLKLLAKFKHIKSYVVTTYGCAGKENPDDYDLIILDESHNFISGYPKPSSTWSKLAKITKGKPLIYLSATPHAQGHQMLYHQFALSAWSPWHNYSNFYNWHRHYGIVYQIKVHDKDVNQYDKCNTRLVKAGTDHLFITKTRKELGFTHEPKDKIHWIELDQATKDKYNTLLDTKVLTTTPQPVIADSVIKLRYALHMLEGGTIKSTLNRPPKPHPDLVITREEKIEDLKLYHVYYELANREKIDYILNTWGDNDNVIIMYNFQAEAIKLAKVFKNAEILQATSFAEGIDRTGIEHLVIYSQDYSTARHTQRRARQAGMDREWQITVNYLLTRNAISHQAYKTVAVNKKNYVDSRFERVKL